MSAQNGDCSDARTFANEQEGELRWFPWIGDGLVLVEKNWRQAGGGGVVDLHRGFSLVVCGIVDYRQRCGAWIVCTAAGATQIGFCVSGIQSTGATMASGDTEQRLIGRIRAGDADAWQSLIDQYEGRLLAWLRVRIGDSTAAEDLVQETFVGFLRALPGYDESTPLESWLYTIATHKLIDELRRRGRRPAVALPGLASRGAADLIGPGRRASSMYLSRETDRSEAALIGRVLAEFVSGCIQQGAWERLMCIELLLVRGWSNKRVAEELGLTEKQVANHKYFVMEKMRQAARSQEQSVRIPPELEVGRDES